MYTIVRETGEKKEVPPVREADRLPQNDTGKATSAPEK
jgi:hypothetical protein